MKRYLATLPLHCIELRHEFEFRLPESKSSFCVPMLLSVSAQVSVGEVLQPSDIWYKSGIVPCRKS